MNEAVYRGYQVVAFMPFGQEAKEKFKVILTRGCVVEHIEIRKNSACPDEEAALGRGLLLVRDRIEAQERLIEELASEGPVDLPQESVSSTGWEVPERGWESE